MAISIKSLDGVSSMRSILMGLPTIADKPASNRCLASPKDELSSASTDQLNIANDAKVTEMSCVRNDFNMY